MEVVDNIFAMLRRDEGEVLEVYLDSRGIRIAGVGHNIQAHNLNWLVGTKITKEQSYMWLIQDVEDASDGIIQHLPWSVNLWTIDHIRFSVLINMCFNLGINGLMQFHRTLTSLEDKQWIKASQEMLNSKWAEQVGDRAKRLSEQIRTGEWQ